MFGLKAGTCVSNKLRCRKTSECPKNYLCLGNNLELTEGTCIRSITNDPISGAMVNVVNPVTTYKQTHTINWFYLLIFLGILFGIGWMIYSTFFQTSEADGSCGQSADCMGPDGNYYQCGTIKTPFVCNCKKYASGGPVASPIACGGAGYSSAINCRGC